MKLTEALKKRIHKASVKGMMVESAWIYGYAKKYKLRIAIYVVLGILGTAIGIASGIISKTLIDSVNAVGVQALRTKGIVEDAIVYIAMGLAVIAVNAVMMRISERISINTNNEIRENVFRKILDSDWEAMSAFHSGDLLNRLNEDVSAVAGSIVSFIPSLIINVLKFIAALAVMLYTDDTMALLVLISAPITILFSRVLVGRMRGYSKQMRQSNSTMTAFKSETLANMQTVKAFGLTELFGDKLKALQEDYKSVSLKYNKFQLLTSSALTLMGKAVFYVCVGFGIYRVCTSTATIGTVALFIQLAALISASFSALVALVPSSVTALTAAGRIMEILRFPCDTQKDTQAAEFLKDEARKEGAVVELKKVSFAYSGEKAHVFSNVDFSAYPNETVAIIGHSGAGKTTLLRLILGLLRFEGGSARVIALKSGRAAMLSANTRGLFAYVPQGNTVFAGTIADNLRMVKQNASDDELRAALKAACAYEFIEELPGEINCRVGEHGQGFSEGQAQRISLARALLSDAPILLLDEATSALDEETERKVLNNITASHGKRTCIVTTHRASVVSACASVYRINGDKIYKLSSKEVEILLTNKGEIR